MDFSQNSELIRRSPFSGGTSRKFGEDVGRATDLLHLVGRNRISRENWKRLEPHVNTPGKHGGGARCFNYASLFRANASGRPFDSRTVPGHTARMLIGLCICTHTQAQSNEWKAQRENAQRHEREWASTSDDFQWKWDSSRRMPTAALLCTRQLGQKNGKCSKKAHTSTKVDGHRPSKTFEENSAG